MVYSTESCFMMSGQEWQAKYWLKLQRKISDVEHNPVYPKDCRGQTIFIPLCCPHVQTCAGRSGKLSSSACYVHPLAVPGRAPRGFPGTWLLGRERIATQSSETCLKTNFKWLILVLFFGEMSNWFQRDKWKKTKKTPHTFGHWICFV